MLHTRALPPLFLTLLLVLSSAATAAGPAVTSIAFERAVLDDLGIAVEAVPSAASELDEGNGFAGTSALVFDAPGGDFESFSGGAVVHAGELTFTIREAEYSLSRFELRVAADPKELELFDELGQRWLLFQDSQPFVAGGELNVQNIDVNVAPELATLLGRPELAGSYLGRAHVRAPGPLVPAPVGGTTQGGGPCDPVFTSDRDVSLLTVGRVSQLAREPGGRVGLTFSARLRNEGTSSILWKEAIDPDDAPENDTGEHPFLALHFYRLANGRLTQIGRSDVKHAFFAVNSNCPCSGGHIIYSGCEDTYGASTNADRLHLALRDEVSAGTGGWSSLGSHFDGPSVDDFRDHQGNADHDDFEHRLLVDESSLQAGGRYFAEAWYIIRDDVDLFNGVGHDEVLPTFGGSTWSFATLTTLLRGSILDELVDPAAPAPGSSNRVLDTGEGRLQLAVSTTDLGGGLTHYEYALMNFDFDRQVDSFSVPLRPDIAVSNVSFADGDVDLANDWTATSGTHSITWDSAPGNRMDWGTLYSFGFDADRTPVETTVSLGAFEAGSPSQLQIEGQGPAPSIRIPVHGSPLWPIASVLALLALAAHRIRRRDAAS